MTEPVDKSQDSPLPEELRSIGRALADQLETEGEDGGWIERVLGALRDLGYQVAPAAAPKAAARGEWGAGAATLEDLESARRQAEEILRRGEPLLAFNLADLALADWPDDLRLRQIKGLALARSGAALRARAVLQKLRDEGHADGETLGLLARTHKDLAARVASDAERRVHLGDAFKIYEEAYRDSAAAGRTGEAYYTGINAATLAALLDLSDRAREIAHHVRELCESELATGAGGEYWLRATLGEASLILGEEDAAGEHYRRAAELGAGRWGDLSSTRRQARTLLAALNRDPAMLDAILPVPPVLVYTGHMIDQPGRRSPRFPAELELRVAEEIRKRLDRFAPAAAYGSAACGADLLVLEAMLERGAEIHVILPFPPDDFRRTSVLGVEGHSWETRFERVLESATSVTVTSDHYAEGSASTFHYANLILTGMAELRRRALDTELVPLAIWDGRPAGGAGGTGSLVEHWQGQGLEIEHVDLGAMVGDRDAGPAPALSHAERGRGRRHVLRSMLFADATGYSKLTESQIPLFVGHFLGKIAEVMQDGGHQPVLTETMGDGIYSVFETPAEAGLFALDLSEMVVSTQWEVFGLPEGLGLRIALHAGPVYHCHDPITGLEKYTGPHTSRTARIEPITPPGSVYASSAFAAIAAAEGVAGLDFDYVGHTTLAKKYGALALYHVKRVFA